VEEGKDGGGSKATAAPFQETGPESQEEQLNRLKKLNKTLAEEKDADGAVRGIYEKVFTGLALTGGPIQQLDFVQTASGSLCPTKD